MHPDREALIAGIAADPDNDLRRLVFADWLEEHGEAERAEFIRLQIHCDSAQESIRAGELFEQHARRWFAPFLSALDSVRDLADGYGYHRRDRNVFLLRSQHLPRGPAAYVWGADVSRGFVSRLTLELSQLPHGSALGVALACEPVTDLEVTLALFGRRWTEFSWSALRQIRALKFTFVGAADEWADTDAIFADPHLAGVRTLTVSPVFTSGMPPRTIPIATVEALVWSPLSRQLTELAMQLDDDGLRALCRAKRSAFSRLTALDLSGRAFSRDGLRALAAAPFLPQLEVLSLSGTWGTPAADDLRAVADALNPAVLRLLKLAGFGFGSVPDFLAAKFGDRVVLS